MTIYLTTTRTAQHFIARFHTEAGALIGQAVDHSQAVAEKRALRQARKWGDDRDWGPLTIRKGKVPA